jgi:hypothetical protein
MQNDLNNQNPFQKEFGAPQQPTQPTQPVPQQPIPQQPVPQQPVSQQPVYTPNEVPPVFKPEVSKPNILSKVLPIVVLIVIVALGLGGYYLYSGNSKVILNNSFKNFERIANYIENPIKLDNSENRSITGAFSFNVEESTELEMLNNIDFNYEFAATEDLIKMSLGLNKGNEYLGAVQLFSTEDTGYIFLDKIFDKYIEYSDLKGFVSTTDVNKEEDYDYIYKFLVKSLIKNAIDDNLVKGTAEIKINNEDVSVNELELSYTEEELIEVLGLIIEDIKSDEKADEIFTDLYPEYKDIDTDDMIRDLDKDYMSEYYYVIYTNKLTNAVVGMDFVVEAYELSTNYDDCNFYGMDYDFDDCTYEEYESYKTGFSYRKEKNDNFYFYEYDLLEARVEVIKEKDGLTLNLYDYEDEEVGNIKIVTTKDLIEIDFNFEDDYSKAMFNYKMDIKEVVKGQEYELDAKMTLESYSFDDLDESLSMDITYLIKNESDINANFNNSVNYEDLTEDDTYEILENLMEIMEKVGS